MSFVANVGKLDGLNPLSVISRGYSVVQKNEKSLSSVSSADIGDLITVRLSDGSLSAEVKSKTSF